MFPYLGKALRRDCIYNIGNEKRFTFTIILLTLRCSNPNGSFYVGNPEDKFCRVDAYYYYVLHIDLLITWDMSFILLHRGCCMIVHVLLNLLTNLGKRYKT